MPVYEYRCDEGHEFEVVQRMSDDALTTCEICGSPARRVLFAPAIHFKGTGFHNTDYGTRKRGPREAEKSETGGKTDGGAAGGGASGDGGTKKVKEATPSDTAKRGTGP